MPTAIGRELQVIKGMTQVADRDETLGDLAVCAEPDLAARAGSVRSSLQPL